MRYLAPLLVAVFCWPCAAEPGKIAVIDGAIESIKDDTLTIKPAASFKISPKIKVTIDGQDKSLADLKPGMSGRFAHRDGFVFRVIIGDLKAGVRNLSPKDFSTGAVCKLAQRNGDPYKFKVVRIIDKDSMVMLLAGQPDLPFLVRTSTADRVDGQVIELPGVWRVVGTTKVGERTMFALEPDKGK